MPKLQTAEMKRFGRDLYRRALDLRFKAEDGDAVRDDPILKSSLRPTGSWARSPWR